MSLLSVFSILPVRRVRLLLLLSTAALLLSAGVAQAQTVYGDFTVVGTGADAGISFEFLSSAPLLTPGLSTTFSFVNCTVPAGETCGTGTAQVNYSASGGQIRLTTTGASGKTRTWNFPSLLHTGVYIGQTGAGLEPGYVVFSGADATAGQPQSNAINSNFQFPIEVTVNDPTPSYQGSVTVTFTAPGSGPSASFSDGGLAMTDISGRARLTPTANGIAGAYQITATAAVGANTFQTSFVAANVNTADAAGACLVTTANDDFSVGSLRYQVAACGKGGTITFASGINTVNLSVAQDIPLTQDLTIDGGGGVTIDANVQSRIFFIAGGTITLKNLTLENGIAAGGVGGVGTGGEGAGGGAAGMGGAIFVNAGSLAIANVTFTNDQATGGSGGSTLSGFFSGGGGGTGGPGGSSALVIAGNGGGGGDFGSSGGEGTDGPSNGPGDGAGGGQIGSGAFGGGGAGGGTGGAAGGFGGGGGGGLSIAGTSGTFGGNGGPNSPAGGGYGGAGLGGAIFMRNGALSLTNATFISNLATGGTSQSGGSNGQGKGGALYISSTASAVSIPALPTFSANSSASAGTGTACNTVVGSNALDTNDICGILTGPATHFSVSAPPSVTSFIAYQITVTALDDNNNVVTGYTGTLHLTSTDPGFVNSTGDSTLTNGVGTFNVVMKQAGTQTITATDTADTFITGTSNSILVNPGAPAFVTVSASATTNGGATFPFTVTVTDLFGNLATSYSGTLHFTSSDAAAVLPADSTLTGGTGIFNATLETQGTQTITATDTVTNTLTGTSNGITVSIPSLVVTTTADSGPGTLRAALATAAADGSANITFDPTVFATPQTITLSSGTLTIPSNTTITGPTSGSGATLKNLVTVSGGGASNNFSMFTVNNGGTDTAIHNLVIANGYVDSQGGGITSSGSLTVTGCTFANNYAAGYMGSGNGGGAIFVGSGTLAISDSTFVGNTSAPGGAITASSGIVAINQSTFSGNSALDAKVGGAIFINTGVMMTIAGSTFSGNSAAGGGAVFNNSTLAATNTIMAGNTGGDCGAGGSSTCPTNGANGNVIGVSGISLAPLGDYGGSTQTMIPLPGSPAICAGSIAAIPGGVTADQRGDARTTAYGGTTCTDAGAVQTNYSLNFSQQPTGGSANATITPSPAVQLYENGVPIALSGAPIPISASSGTLNGTATQSTDNNGQATFGGLSIGTPQTNDALTASVALTAAGSPTPEAASVTSIGFDITTLTPAITFTVPNHTYGDAAFPVAATSNSSGIIAYSVVSGPATISGSIVTLTGVGPVALEASQDASGPYAAATQQATFNVVKATPSITWVPASSISYGTSLSAILNASASSNGASVPGTFSYTAQAGGSAVPVTAVTVLVPGSYTLVASFTPSVTADYEPATTSVHLLVGQVALTVTANNAGKVYGTPNPAFTGTVTGAVNNDSFTEMFSTAATSTSNVGIYAIVPSVTGADASDYTVTATNGTFTVTKAATATTLGASANSIASGQSLTLNTQVMDTSAGSTGTPTGIVNFYDGTTLLGASTLTNNTASYTTATLAPGATHTLTAIYVGDGNFTASTSNAGTIVVAAPPDFAFTGATPAAYTAAPGAVATYSFSLSPLSGGYPGPVGFTAAGLPANATATFTPSSVVANAGPTTVGMTIQTAPAVARNSSNLLGRGIVLALLLLPFSVSRDMRKKLKGSRNLLAVLLLFGTMAAMTGCGSGNGFLLQKTQTYTLTVTATSGTTQHSQTVTLIVQ